MRGRLVPLALALAWGCLPKDTRPPPGKVTITVSASELTFASIPAAITADGYDIWLTRVLVNLGQAEVGGDDNASQCSDYSSPDYTRLFDFKQVARRQELGIAYAIGHCPFGFSVRFPGLGAKLGTGVNEDDRTFMRTPGNDRLSMNQGVSVYVEGVAQRGAETKHFAWPFRKRIGYRDCGVPLDGGDDGGAGAGGASAGNAGTGGVSTGLAGESGASAMAPALTTGIDLVSSGEASVNIEIQAEALFGGHRPGLLHFEPYAVADADGDGEITLDELWTVPLETVRASGLYRPIKGLPGDGGEFPCMNDDGADVVVKTLGDYAYCALLMDVARFQGNGSCTTIVGRSRRD
jgi:hypothetical protein